jgi:hypothetical protein
MSVVCSAIHPAVVTLSHQFEASNIERFDWERCGLVLDQLHRENGRSLDQVVALSRLTFNFLVVWSDGHVTADQRGLFKKRIEVDEPVSYDRVAHLLRDQKGVRGRDGMLIQGFDSATSQAFELNWGCGGPVSIEDAANERDRIFAIIEQLLAGA